jgi:hypothetical protein
MLHSNGLLLRLHLLVLLSLLVGCLGHGSLMLRASRLLAHLLLLLEQVGRKVDECSLSHLAVSHCLQLLCLCLVQVCHRVRESHSHAALLVGKHGLLLLPVHVGLLSSSLLLHHCRVHHLVLLLLLENMLLGL